MVTSIRLTDETYSRLGSIKKGIESKASDLTKAKMKMTFDELINKLCEVYEKEEGP